MKETSSNLQRFLQEVENIPLSPVHEFIDDDVHSHQLSDLNPKQTSASSSEKMFRDSYLFYNQNSRSPSSHVSKTSSKAASYCSLTDSGFSNPDCNALPPINLRSSSRGGKSYSAMRKKVSSPLRVHGNSRRTKYEPRSPGRYDTFTRYTCKRDSTQLTAVCRRNPANAFFSLDLGDASRRIHENVRYRSEPKCVTNTSDYITANKNNNYSRSKPPAVGCDAFSQGYYENM